MSENENKSAAELVGPPRPIYAFRKIASIFKPKDPNIWKTFTFILDSEMKPGDTDHGRLILLDSFITRKAARKYCKKMMKDTGSRTVHYAPAGYIIELNLEPKSTDEIVMIGAAEGKRIKDIEDQENKKERKQYDKQLAVQKDMMEEMEREKDVDDPEYFKRCCYLAVKHRSEYETYMKQAEEAKKRYDEAIEKARIYNDTHPGVEAQFLNNLKLKLTERDELKLYESIEVGYKLLRDEIIGEKVKEEVEVKVKEEINPKIDDGCKEHGGQNLWGDLVDGEE